MSDSLIELENGSSCFDVEAQQSLLQLSAVDAEADTALISAQTSHTATTSTSNFMSVILVLRSVEIFKGALFHPLNSITSSDSHSSISPTYETLLPHHHHQDSGTVSATLDISADPTDEDILISAYDSASNEHQNNVELQQIQANNITEIVKNEDLQGLHDIGGVRGAAEALNTDLVNGISSRQDISPHKPSQLCFGVSEEGFHTGWYNSAILMFNVFLLVILKTIHKCWESISEKKLGSCWQSRGRKMQVIAVREGRKQLVHEIDLEVGDVVHLRKGDRVPADGLYIAGQALELEGSIKLTTIDEHNPFLFYGCRVVNGDARMLITSTGMDTVWGEMMSQAMQYADNKCKFETYLQKLNNCIHITGLLISILIIIVLFLRYIAGKLDDERRYRPDTKGEPTPVRTIIDVFKGIITGPRGTVRVLTTLLSLSLLGVMEGMAFVIAVAAIVWSRKTLAHRATGRDYQACLKMACVTTICTDKIGGLTEHEQEIDKFYVGEEFISESSVVASNILEGLSDGISTLFLINPSACESDFVPLMLLAEAKLGMNEESVIKQCEMIESSGWIKQLNLRSHDQSKGNEDGSYKGSTLNLMEGGVRTILASGDSTPVLRSIGEYCGLLTPDSEDLVLTAEEFRGRTEEEKMDKEKGQVVALLAQQTIDAPALKQANIGLAYGTWSSEIARECCDISIWDSNLLF
ncbi:UNVERIFIED_CONTAM: Calcium-transporting ATPase 12, plasma membrane-type [Sesamum calycinum]|uniref:Calcium-transporting ATPase 12, plasma membrane-type n=1 Tax=Sesamum calycinum TaxID=2727403 RepID=A0AAW2Q5U9_9LAMI